MPQVINTNIASLNAQRNLNKTQSDLATSLQRLSSGLRINSAKDDAAGLAISERMTTQIRGINQAIRNANDGVSLAQTAEGALGELTNNLQRIRELAVQSANSTNSASDRAALDLEVQQRLAEIDRIATQTTFNGLKVLDGSFGSAAFQIGANVGETITVTLDTSANMRTSAIGAVANAQSGDLSAVIVPPTDAAPATPASIALGAFTGATETSGTNPATYTLTLDDGDNTVNIAVNVAANGTLDAAALAAALNTAGFSGDNTTVSGFTMSLGGEATVADAIANDALSFSRADGVNFTVSEAVGGAGTLSTTPGFANVGTTTNGVEAQVADSGTPLVLDEGEFTVQIGSRAAVSITGEFESAEDLVKEINARLTGAIATLNEDGTMTITSSEAITVAGDDTVLGSLGYTAGEYATAGNLASASVSTQAGANATILGIDSALTSVNNLRSTFGAIQNRFESTIANLSAVAENLSAARSRILDADFAAETARMTSAQILQQAGVSILAQANSLPQLALSLLQ